ncbi:NAD(P)-binding protein [Rhizoclosmatium globosum]|uniref:NAD(P)-binding protein n=1 Tax=Rhizoclosmatium globosum TaxID=329046 RepID=A0A1Y2C9Z4_9FUNG|nr:NAD(P)-binding protein [Rhizoclosmatium globosum]|eukprot:ORY43853.1 NAD(P)-binding protein [Rhizoclosmatium globosum]
MENTVIYALGAVGALYLGTQALKFAYTVVNAYVIPGKPLKAFGVTRGSWAIVTGASDGLGKEFSLQLAGSGVNVLLVARNASKLSTVEKEITEKNGAANVRTHVIDFANAGDAEYDAFAKVVGQLDNVRMLVNNVGTNHEFPVEFLDENGKTIEDIVNVNINAQMRVTRIVAPLLVANKKGLILNIGSLAGIVPSGLLSVYSASKSFLRFWSDALAMELKPKGVHVEHIRAFFVVSAMSKIRKPTWTTPTAKNFVKAVLKNVGKSIDSAPYPSHAILSWFIETFMSESFAIKESNKMHIDIRKRALKKKEREAAAAAASAGKKEL